MIDLGYKTHNPIITMRTLVVLQLYYAIRIMFLFGVLFPIKTFYAKRFYLVGYDFFKSWYKNLYSKLIFSEILVIIFGSFIELLIAGSLFYSTPSNYPDYNALNFTVACYFNAIPFIIVPSMFFWMFC